MDLLNEIFEKLYGIVISIPLVISLFYICGLILIKRPKFKLIVKIALFLLGLFLFGVVTFLLYCISVIFIFDQFTLSQGARTAGLILFCLYFGFSFFIIVAIGQLGHGGVSPSRVFIEILNLFRKEKLIFTKLKQEKQDSKTIRDNKLDQ